MRKFEAHEFIDLLTLVAGLSYELGNQEHNEKTATEAARSIIVDILERTQGHCEHIGLEVSIEAIVKTKRLLEADCKVQILKKSLDTLQERIIDEIKLAPLMLGITRDRAWYFATTSPFGEQVASEFPSAKFDIEEAAKCFALARYTASVMHLQRTMECGLTAFGNYVGIDISPPPTFNPEVAASEYKRERGATWQDKLERCLTKFKERDTKRSWASAKDREFCLGVYPFIMAVKNAWRNPAMHAEKSYGESEAKDILHAVEGFMHYLSEHINEAGSFKQ